MYVNAVIELTDKEQQFVYWLGYGAPQTRAATLAGYSVGHAATLVRKAHIRAALLALHENTKDVLRRLDKSDQAKAAAEREAAE